MSQPKTKSTQPRMPGTEAPLPSLPWTTLMNGIKTIPAPATTPRLRPKKEQRFGLGYGLLVIIAVPLAAWRFVMRLFGKRVTFRTCKKCRPHSSEYGPRKICKHLRSNTSFSTVTVCMPQRKCAGAFFYFNRGSRSLCLVLKKLLTCPRGMLRGRQARLQVPLLLEVRLSPQQTGPFANIGQRPAAQVVVIRLHVHLLHNTIGHVGGQLRLRGLVSFSSQGMASD